jgi:hypothetical protein
MNIYFLISILTFLFVIFMFFYLKRYIFRRTSALELLSEYRTEVYRLIAEIDSATDRDSQLVEARIKNLKSLLEETDKRISVYVRELDRSRTGEALYTSLGRGIRAAMYNPPEPAALETSTQAAQETPLPADSPSLQLTPQQALSTPVSRDSILQPVSQPQPEPASQPNGRQLLGLIEDLAVQGLPRSEIASRLEISLSEVDLAFNLLGRSGESRR